MPKTKISEFSATPGNNTDIDGINLAEGCAPSGINDAIRELMAQLKDFQAGTAGDSFNGPVGTTTAAAGAFTTLTTSSTVTHNGGTANGVAYLNGSKVLTTGSALTFDGTNLSTGNGSFLANGTTGITSFRATTTSNYAELQSRPDISYSRLLSSAYLLDIATLANQPILFTVNSSEQMRLTSTGLGIGTSSPGVKLDVSGADGVRARVIATAGGTPGLILSSSGNTAYTIKAGNADNSLRIDQDGTDRITLASGGNLGIGTSSPAYKLDVVGPVQSSAGYYINGNTSGGYIWVRDNYALRFGTNDTERMRLDSSGNLGLGVTPSAWNSDYKNFAVGTGGQFFGRVSTTEVGYGTNYYRNAAGNFIYLTTAAASYQAQVGGIHYWFTAPSGTAGNAITFTQAMTLDASGNLGVGTTSPAVRLHVDSSGGGIVRVTRLASSAGAYGQLEHDGTNTTLTSSAATIFNAGGATERARITSGGAWQVGTSGVYTEHATVQRAANEYTTTFVSPRATAAQNFGLQVTYSAADPNGTGNFFLYCEANGTIRANIRSNGGIANYSANNVNLSDRREKTNFAPAKSYIDAICAIPVQTFNYVDQNMEEDPGLTLGVVAQDVQAVAPELVMESNWAKEGEDPKMRLSIYQTDLQYALMKCIQEQQVMINELKAKVAALEAK